MSYDTFTTKYWEQFTCSCKYDTLVLPIATEFIGSAVVPAGVDVDLGGWPHSSSRPSEERFSLTGSLLRHMFSRSTKKLDW